MAALTDLDLPGQVMTRALVETEHNFLDLHLFGYDQLVVTFEDARGPVERPDRWRMGWGVAPFLKRGVSVLAVKPKRCHWYSTRDLGPAFADLAPVLARFGEVVTYGMSMGGFAALTHADALGAKRVVALAPQASYREIKGRREMRWPETRNFDHSAPHGDAAQGCRTPGAVWILYDRMERRDRWHAERMQGAHVHHLGLPYFSHGVARMLQNIGALPRVVDLVLTGQIDRPALYREARDRRFYAQYQEFIFAKARQHPAHRSRLEAILGPDPFGPLEAPAQVDDKNDGFSSQTE